MIRSCAQWVVCCGLWVGCASSPSPQGAPASTHTESRLEARGGQAEAPASDVFAEELTPEQAALREARRTVQRKRASAGGARHGQLASKTAPQCAPWQLWARFCAEFVQQDGRVVDRTAEGRSTSEGQAYGLFFALVANEPERFARILKWTEQNLAKGSLAQHLPAWLWGQRPGDGAYGVLDGNAASDADLWIAYALFEASRLWGEPTYEALAQSIARNVVRLETRRVKGLGQVLLPGPEGFALKGGAVRLNPSYLVIPQLRLLAERAPGAAWVALVESSAKVLTGSAPRGIAPDWVVYHPVKGFQDDTEHHARGSYDAIRVYLWQAMLPARDPLASRLAVLPRAFVELIQEAGHVPEAVHVRKGHGGAQSGPPGFWAVAQVAATAAGQAGLAARMAEHLRQTRSGGLYGDPPTYYDQMLVLFAQGYSEARYRFAASGQLQLAWEAEQCAQ